MRYVVVKHDRQFHTIVAVAVEIERLVDSVEIEQFRSREVPNRVITVLTGLDIKFWFSGRMVMPTPSTIERASDLDDLYNRIGYDRVRKQFRSNI